ncbi:RHS repeat domain-containing protein [Paenibacillus sp. KN14-4R]|uniref:RHS repeat domain-containing protein n=1 Tax=Paenibacillus sp. KN14-4R TaxID=3445773 RepID=UPI003FA008C6
MTDPFGKMTNYAYQAGRLDKVGQDLTKPDASYTYKAGNLDRIDLNSGKIITNHVYTEGMLSDVTHKTDVGQAQGSYGYEYDDYANITKLKENSEVTSSLTYDPLHRVQTNSMFKEAYQYNNRGNRETLQSDKLPQIPLNQYKYDSRDQLIEVKAPAKNNGEAKQVAYVYNGQGLMVKRTESNQADEGDKRVSRYYYDADSNIIAEEKTEGDTTSQYSYIRSRGQLVAKVDQAGSKQYYLHNGHGDVVSITDDQGNKLAEYKYDIWGKILPAEGNNLANKVDNIFLYSGEYYDETTELQYLRARWYDPSIGRFINEDTYKGEIANPLSLNLYTYAKNNPLRYTDPTGHMVFDSDDDGTNNVQSGITQSISNNWKVLKEYNSTPRKAAAYWTMGLTELFYTVANAPMNSPEYWAANGEIGFNLATFGTGRLIGSATNMGNRVVKKGVGIVEDVVSGCNLPSYSKSVLDKMKKDPTAHNFPTSFDKQILSQKPALLREDGRAEYLLTGSMNGKDGVYHMTVRPSDNSIIHRVFIPSSDWARFSKANGLPSLNAIP